MMLRCKRFLELIVAKVLSDKIGIEPGHIASYKGVPVFPAEQLVCLQARSEIGCPIPRTACVILYFPINPWWNKAIVFDDDDSGMQVRHGFPKVVRVAIDIQGQQIKLRGRVPLLKDSSDIFRRDKGV